MREQGNNKRKGKFVSSQFVYYDFISQSLTTSLVS